MRKEEEEAVKSFLIDYDKLAGDAEGMYQEVLDDAINIGDFSGKYDKKEYCHLGKTP